MPYKDPAKQAEARRRYRVRQGLAVPALAKLLATPNLPDPPPREQLLKVLGVLAREGNLAAIRLLLQEYRRAAAEGERPSGSIIDELATRRKGG